MKMSAFFYNIGDVRRLFRAAFFPRKTHANREIILWGYYGCNYGDILMMRLILAALRERNVRPIVVTVAGAKAIGPLKTDLAGSGIDVLCWNEFIGRPLEKIIFLLYYRKLLHVWGGGTVFTDSGGDGNLAVFKWLYRLGGRFAYLNSGLGLITKKERRAAAVWLLRRSTLTLLRDEGSLRDALELGAVNVHLTGDLPLLYAARLRRPGWDERDHVLVTYRFLKRNLTLAAEAALCQAVARYAFEEARRLGLPIIVQPLDFNSDEDSCRTLLGQIEKLGGTARLSPETGMDEIARLMGKAALHISGRLHGSVVSEALGTPTISLSYCRKTDEFYRAIGGGCVLSVYDLNLDALRRCKPVSRPEPVFAPGLLERCEQNFPLLFSVMDLPAGAPGSKAT